MTEAPIPAPGPRPLRITLPRFPVRATYALIAINALVFLADLLLDQTVTIYGALVPVLVVDYRQWWRLISTGFLHADLVHVAANLYAFYGLGRLMERFYGTRRLLVVYMLALLGCSTLVTLLSVYDRPTVGASGAIMGVLGAMVVFFWQYRDRLVGARGYLGQLLRLALINIGIGLLPGISWWGHLGGFLVGAAAGFALLPQYGNPDWVTGELSLLPLTAKARWGVLGLIGAEALLLALAFLGRG
jgi:membrane associated rhomboid family serine protease